MNAPFSNALAVSGDPTAQTGHPMPKGQWTQAMPILKRYWRGIVRQRWFILGVIVLALLIGLVATLLTTRQYTATARIEISRDRDTIIDTREQQPSRGPADMEFYQTQYSLLQARSLAERVADTLRLPADRSFIDAFEIRNPPGVTGAAAAAARRNAVVETLMARIKIAPIRGSALVDVGFTSPDPALSMRIANAWTDAFVSSNLERRYNATAYARRFLETRLADLRKRLEVSERQSVQYASDQGIINLPIQQSGQGSQPIERPLAAVELERLNAELTQAIADRAVASARGQNVGNASAESVANASLGAMRQSRAQAQSEYADLLARFEPGYPAVMSARAKVAALDQSIAREEARISQSLGGNVRAADQRVADLQQRVNALKADVLNQRRLNIQYNIYQRDVETSRELYNALLQRYKEIGVSAGVGTNNISVVDPAKLPDGPSSPRLVLNLLLALLVGIAVAAAGTFALEQIDEGIKDPGDIPRILGLPVLGVVPKIANQNLIELIGDRKSAVSESYLSARTNLQFATDHGVPRSFMVTSTQPAEGKSITSFALAMSLWRTNRRAILIDADMRSPSVHSYLGFDNVEGVSNFLSGDDDLARLLKSSNDGVLTVMTAGPHPPNAAELLSGDRFSLLIERLLTQFDHVIIDSPPVLGLADAPLIASAVEGTVFVVRANGVGSTPITAALSRVASATPNILGVVLTHYDARKAQHGYDYDYGYGYGADDQPNRSTTDDRGSDRF